jgi:glutathione S-transferase
LFNPATPAEYKSIVIEKLQQRLQFIDQELAGKSYLMGEQFSVADAYLFTVSNWARLVKVDISSYENLLAYRARLSQRPAFISAMQAEGIYKPA